MKKNLTIDPSMKELWPAVRVGCFQYKVKVEKKNDVISDIIVRMRHDKDFLSVVTLMYNLDSEQLGGVRQMLSAFAK